MAREPGKKRGVEIRLLGDVSVLRAGERLALPGSKKTRALLSFLVASHAAHTRERLCDLLWEGPDDPRGGLRWSLSKLRALLDEPHAQRLIADREQVRFEACAADVDLFEVRALFTRGLHAASTEELSQAAARFRGRFLEGLELPDCVRFYAWCVAEREQVRSLELGLLNELCARLAETPESALKYARALVSLDPLAESSHLRVVRLLAALGRKREALAECERCRRILKSEIGSRPSAELEKLRFELAQSATSPTAALAASPEHEGAPRAPAALQKSSSLPLVGRSVELTRFAELLGEAREHRASQALLLVGDPGVGKSSLLQAFADGARRAGGIVLSSRAFEAEAVRPYGPFLDALRSAPFDEGLSELSRRLQELLPKTGPEAQGKERGLLFEAMAAVVRKLAASRTFYCLVLDDIQWLDESSAALLHFIVRELLLPGFAVVCAARAGELADRPATHRALRALAREGRLQRLSVAPLDLMAVTELVLRVAPGSDPAQIFEQSRGNPLFALELLRARESRESALSDGVNALIQERLERLDEPARATLPWAAALGHSFELGLLATLSGLPPATLLSALEELERHGLVQPAGANACDFSHDIVRQAAYALMSEPRRRFVHARIAQALSAQPDPEGALAGEVLHHAALASDHELAAKACVTAGRRCARLFAYADAHALSRRGFLHALELAPAARLSLQVELLGLRTQRRSAPKDAQPLDTELAAVMREAGALGLDGVVARAAEFSAIVRYGLHDERGVHESTLRQLESGRAAGPAGVPRFLAAARCLAHLEHDMPRVERSLDEASRLLGVEAEPLELCWARGLLQRFRGEYELALADLTRVAAEQRREGRNWHLSWCLRDLVLTELERGRPDAALEPATRLAEVTEKMGEGVDHPAALAFAALARIALAEPDAWRDLDAALAEVRAADGKVMLATCANFAAELALWAGESERARRHAEQARDAARAMAHPSQAALAEALLLTLRAEREPAGALRSELRDLEERAARPLAVSLRARIAVERARARLTPNAL